MLESLSERTSTKKSGETFSTMPQILKGFPFINGGASRGMSCATKNMPEKGLPSVREAFPFIQKKLCNKFHLEIMQ